MGIDNIHVCFNGGESKPPSVKMIPKNCDLAKVMQNAIESATNMTPLFFLCQPGKGKTHGVVHGALPWAIENHARILYISSRQAINIQTKDAIIEAQGLDHLKKELTREGMRAHMDFGCITVMTYHKLYLEMRYNPGKLNRYDLLIFDEVHALIEDATYVGLTGYVLDHLKSCFPYARRLYMTATASDILPQLIGAERPYKVQVYHMPKDYSFILPHFFSETEDIQKIINSDTSNRKWLVYMPHISAGNAFCKGLECSFCTLNGKERDKDPEKWYEILDNQKFSEKVCVVTSVVDAGVNIHDDLLTNLVIFSTSPVTLTQVLGRKRLKDGEQLHVYAYSPSPDEILSAAQKNQELQDKLAIYDSNPSFFMEHYVLTESPLNFRAMMYAESDGGLHLNRLTKVHLQNEAGLYQKFLEYADKNKDSLFFDVFFARWLNISLPDRSETWVDSNYVGKEKQDFLDFLKSHCGCEMNEASFAEFSLEFRSKCIAAYGKAPGGKDREDRDWKWIKINNKLAELQLPYNIKNDAAQMTYILVTTG